MSFWAVAAPAANSAVATPTHAMTSVAQASATAITGFTLTIRYTPAVTMVAACIRAETGVGPAMASGSHM